MLELQENLPMDTDPLPTHETAQTSFGALAQQIAGVMVTLAFEFTQMARYGQFRSRSEIAQLLDMSREATMLGRQLLAAAAQEKSLPRNECTPAHAPAVDGRSVSPKESLSPALSRLVIEVLPQNYGTEKTAPLDRSPQSRLSEDDPNSGTDLTTTQSGGVGRFGVDDKQLRSRPRVTPLCENTVAGVDSGESLSAH